MTSTEQERYERRHREWEAATSLAASLQVGEPMRGADWAKRAGDWRCGQLTRQQAGLLVRSFRGAVRQSAGLWASLGEAGIEANRFTLAVVPLGTGFWAVEQAYQDGGRFLLTGPEQYEPWNAGDEPVAPPPVPPSPSAARQADLARIRAEGEAERAAAKRYRLGRPLSEAEAAVPGGGLPPPRRPLR